TSTPHVLPLLPFTAPPPTEISTPSLHDALPISCNFGAHPHRGFRREGQAFRLQPPNKPLDDGRGAERTAMRIVEAKTYVVGNPRSEEHTSELQSLAYLVCRLLLEKKKKSSI